MTPKIGIQLLIGENPEPFLPYAIKSVAWADYFCVCNTGRPDNVTAQQNYETVISEIPKGKLRYAALADHISSDAADYWEKGKFSFADARNLAQELADVDDLVMIVDSDDVHFPEWEMLVRSAAEQGADAVWAKFYHIMVYRNLYQFLIPRVQPVVYKNTSSAHWSKGVHEQLVCDRFSEIFLDDYAYMHYGYLKPQREVCERMKFYNDLEGRTDDPQNFDEPDTILNPRLPSCSILPIEHPRIIQDFLKDYPEFKTHLKVGLLTSWNIRCGVASYSRHLVNALSRRDDVEISVFGSANPDPVVPFEDYAQPVFNVAHWNDYTSDEFDIETILNADLDVLHIQYIAWFYNREKLLELLSRFKGLKVLTFHDNALLDSEVIAACDRLITHREDIGEQARYLMPFGIENRRPVVKTFGLGRSDLATIKACCDNLEYEVEHSFASDKWLSDEDLHNWLRDSDAIVLFYPEDKRAGTSQAARTALATRRPVIVNDVTWFKDVEGVHKIASAAELQDKLFELLDNPTIAEASWHTLAQAHTELYKGLL